MKYYTKFILFGSAYLTGVSYILRDTPEQYYTKKNQEIENLRVNIYQAKVIKINNFIHLLKRLMN
jgi:hypothetical protein